MTAITNCEQAIAAAEQIGISRDLASVFITRLTSGGFSTIRASTIPSPPARIPEVAQ